MSTRPSKGRHFRRPKRGQIWAVLTSKCAVALLAVSAILFGLLVSISPQTAFSPDLAAGSFTPVVITGDSHTCQVATNNVGFCWGENAQYQMGDGGTTDKLTPYKIPGFTWKEIDAGYFNTCGITSSDDVYCWGSNNQGQVGDGTTTTRTTPTKTNTALKFKSLTVSRDGFACAIDTNNDGYCWGGNYRAQGGQGNLTNPITSPTAISGGIKWAQLSAGSEHACGVSTGGTAYCWGYNAYGQVGDNTTVQKQTPTALGGTWSSISAGYEGSCGVTTAGDGYCWGRNNTGQNGNGGTTNSSVPVLIPSFKWTRIWSGDSHSCGIQQSTNLAYCWGNNGSNRVSSVTGNKLSPTQVDGSLQFQSLSAGGYQTCGVLTNNLPVCWGSNAAGQIGDGTLTTRASPVNAFVTRNSNAIADVSANEGNSGTTNFDFTISLDNYSNVPFNVTLSTANGTATAGEDYTSVSTTFNIDPGDTSGVQRILVNGDLKYEGNETFTINLASASSGFSIGDAQAVGTINNDDTNVPPNLPASVTQSKTTTAGIATSGWTNETSVLFRASITDTDPVEAVSLCIEVKPIGTGFSNVEDGCGTAVASSGSAVNTSYTRTGLVNGTQYHWQYRAKDQAGFYSGWTSFGGNAETVSDFGVDTAVPTGVVRDGSAIGSDSNQNNGTLSTLSGNWTFTDASPLTYEYSVGKTPGATDMLGWTSAASATNVDATVPGLNTGQTYFFNIRATDAAGNVSAVTSSDGQTVQPTFAFTVSSSDLTFDALNAGNSYSSAAKSLDVRVMTNAHFGYEIRQSLTTQMTKGAASVPAYAGTYAVPTLWSGIGFGFTTSDTDIGAIGNRFASGTKFAQLSTSTPGDVVADRTAAVVGTPIDETATLVYRVAVPMTQAAGTYSSVLKLTATPIF